MRFWKKNKSEAGNNNRVNIIMAIIFLLGGGALFRLFSLQVVNSDLYVAKASSQHKVLSQLEPERGKIYIQDSVKSDKLYPLATNKKFAMLYAVPKDLKEAKKIPEILYAVFHEQQVLKDVDSLLEKEDKEILHSKLEDVKYLPEEDRKIAEDKILKEDAALRASKDYGVLRQARIEEEIEKMKEDIISGYFKNLKKENDPYELLQEKVGDGKLIEFFTKLLSDDIKQAKAEDFVLKNDRLYVIEENGKEAEVEFEGIDFTMRMYRFYPEKTIGSNMLGFVSYADEKGKGQYGLEGFFSEELTGLPGTLKTERNARGEPIIINDREYVKPKNGNDLVLTINRTIQFEVCKKLNEAVLKHRAAGGSVIVMEPKTGAIMAMCSNPDFDSNDYRDVKDISVYNNPAIFSQYEPGSIFKALTMAMAVDQGKVMPETTYNDTGVVKISNYEIKNSDKKANGVVDMNTVLQDSLNTGVIFAMRKIGVDNFTRYVKDFGFGERTGIELEGESIGNINSLTKEKINKELYAATASFGQGISVTPLQMVSAFGALANGGILMKPYLVKEMIHDDGTKVITQPKQIKRIISERTSMILGGMLVNVVEKGHGKRAGVKGYYVAGKTGTAQVSKGKGLGYDVNAHIGSFAGYAPVNDPAFVMLVRIDQPKDVEWAESSAAPLFGDIAQFLLNYLQIPTERTEN